MLQSNFGNAVVVLRDEQDFMAFWVCMILLVLFLVLISELDMIHGNMELIGAVLSENCSLR